MKHLPNILSSLLMVGTITIIDNAYQMEYWTMVHRSEEIYNY